MQRVIVAAVAVAIALFAAAAENNGSIAGAAMPAPTPAALQYEEISRIVLPPGTPAPPGSFADDRAAVVATANTPAPAHGLFAGLQNSVNQAMSTVHALQTGFLTRYTYYRNWIRTDDVVHQTAVIVKCDLNQYIALDLAHRTYHITSTAPQPEAMSVPGGSGALKVSTASNEPGTVNLTITGSHQNLGPQTLEGISTHGQSADLSVTSTNATGSCKDGSFSGSFVEYLSNIRVPRPYCPVPRRAGIASPMDLLTPNAGGCTPHIQGSASGGTLPNSGDRLAMYRMMSLNGSDENGGRNFKTVQEAGNVQWLGQPDAAALFEIPAGFTQQQ
jgi:hypothetical protein